MRPIGAYFALVIATAIVSKVVAKLFATNTSVAVLGIRGMVVMLSVFLVLFPQKLLLSGVRARDIFFQRQLPDATSYPSPPLSYPPYTQYAPYAPYVPYPAPPLGGVRMSS